MSNVTELDYKRLHKQASVLGDAVKDLATGVRALVKATDMAGSFLTVLSEVMTCIEREVSDIWKLAIMFEINEDASESNVIEHIRFSSVMIGQEPMLFMEIRDWQAGIPTIARIDDQVVTDASAAAIVVIGDMVHGIVHPYYEVRRWVLLHGYRVLAFEQDEPLRFTTTYVAPNGLDGFVVSVDFNVLVRDHEALLEHSDGQFGLIKLDK